MKLKNWLIIFLLSGISCSRIPVQNLELSQALKKETDRMHEVNILLVEYVFNEKKHLVNEFILNEYGPSLIESIVKKLPPDIDLKRELPEIILAVNPRIDARRDSIMEVLQNQKAIIIQQLNSNYKIFQAAFISMQQMQASSSLNKKNKDFVYNDIKNLNTQPINLQDINNALNTFIQSPGNIEENTIALNNRIKIIYGK